MQLNSRDFLNKLCFTTYVVITKKKNTAPPLDCARSGHLHTICSDVTQRKDFITTSQTAVSQYLHQRYVQISFLVQAFSSIAWEGTLRHQHQTHLPPLVGRIFWLVIVHVCTICVSSYPSARSTHSGHHVSDICRDLQRSFHVGACPPAFAPANWPVMSHWPLIRVLRQTARASHLFLV